MISSLMIAFGSFVVMLAADSLLFHFESNPRLTFLEFMVAICMIVTGALYSGLGFLLLL